MLALAFHAAATSAQSIADRVRAARQKPGTPVVIGLLSEPVPLSVEELAKASDLVLLASVSRLTTHVNDDDTAVVTDFAMLPIRVLIGTLPTGVATPGSSTTLVLSTYGGEITRDGVTVRAENHSLEQLKDGRSYLLFLKKFGTLAGVYQIYNDAAFELSENAIRPLTRQGANLFEDLLSTPYSELRTRIQAAAR